MSKDWRLLRFERIGKFCLLALVCAVVFAVAASDAAAQAGAQGQLGVMTYNVNEGTDFEQVLAATSTTDFLIGVGQIVTQVQGTNPPERMQAVAAQILAAGPTLVSLQEVDQWYMGTFNPLTRACGAMSLKYDMLQEILDALRAQGGHYTVAMQAPEIAFPPTPGLIPTSGFFCAALTDNNVILARTDLGPGAFQWSNPQTGQFATKAFLPTPGGVIPITRSWISVDAKFHGSAFRFIGTHLESFVPPIREAQGSELRAGPANTALPVIVAMDSNAQAFPLPQDPTYMDFTAAGYQDVWQEIYPSVPGLTCCQSESDNNPVSQLYQRIDLILTLGGPITAERIALFGADASSRTADGLWPSDHAGVAAGLKFQDDEED